MRTNKQTSSVVLAIFTVAAVLAVSISAFAVTPTPIPFVDDFEMYQGGDSIIWGDAWLGDSNHAIVTNITYSAVTRSITNAPSYGRAVRLDTQGAEISVDFTGTAGNNNIWIDGMFKIVQSDAQPTNLDGDTNVQVAVYFDTNSNLVVYHSKYDGVSSYSNKFTTISASASTDVWHRITIEMDYLTDQLLGSPNEKYFKVLIDGVAASDAEGYVSPDKTSGSPGEWFLCANSANKLPADYQINSIALSGTGLFDDMVVTHQQPAFIIIPTTTTTVVPTTTTAAATTTTVAVTTTMTTTASNVAGVPKAWLIAHNCPTIDPWNTDTDSDGESDGAEWAASTDPDNINSFLQLTIGKENGTNYIEFVADAIDPALPAYGIEKSLDLTLGWGLNYSTHARQNGTNRWTDIVPASTIFPEFYRVICPTNMP